MEMDFVNTSPVDNTLERKRFTFDDLMKVAEQLGMIPNKRIKLCQVDMISQALGIARWRVLRHLRNLRRNGQL